jgi:hypothetical protein
VDNTPQGEVLSGFIVLYGPATCCNLRLDSQLDIDYPSPHRVVCNTFKVRVVLDDSAVVFKDNDLLYLLVLKIHPMLPEREELSTRSCRASSVLGFVLQPVQGSADDFVRRGFFENLLWESEDLERFGLYMDRDRRIIPKENAPCLTFKII